MSGWTSALNVVKTLAPTIGTALGGPLVGGAISALENVFGITPQPSASTDDRQAAVAAAISGATPEQLAAMRSADQSYALAMAQAGFKNTETLASLSEQDTASARVMQVSTKSYTPSLLTALITVGFFTMLGMLMYVNVPDANKAIVYGFTGTLGTAWLVAVHFWFGDTQASARKTEIIAQSTPPGSQQ